MKQGIVYYRDIPAGTLTKDENGFCFHYFDDYYTNSQMPAISVTFPKTQQEYRSPHLFSFFFGLLAEGAQKERQCRELRIDENDHFTRLLETSAYGAIGAVYVKA
jgi:serine/threonine-protein kinase HipA